MFDLEQRLAVWRQVMATAGIGPGDVRDELESHLRDAFEALVAGGLSDEKAFGLAAEKLGAGEALRQEYQSARTPWSRCRAFLSEPVSLFPTDLVWCAWAAAPLGFVLTMLVTIDVYLKGVGFVIWNLVTVHYSPHLLAAVLSPFAGFLIGLYPLVAARDYLKTRALEPALRLAGFWVACFWILGTNVLLAYYARLPGMVPGPAKVPLWIALATSVTAFVGYRLWKKRLRSVMSESVVQAVR